MNQGTHSFCAQRRQALANLIPDNSMVLVSSGTELIRNLDVDYPFRAQSDFNYLTGFEEPDCVLVLLKKAQTVTTLLALRPKDVEQETWHGRRLGIEDAPAVLGVDEAFAIEALDEQAEALLENIQHVFFSFSHLTLWQSMLANWIPKLKSKVRKGIMAPSQLHDLDGLLHEMRLIKTPEEIELIKQAAQISVQGHLKALKITRPGRFEYQIQAALEGEFKEKGSPRVAFNSIVASGDNACILHYTENSDILKAGELLLVDAGAEFGGYAGDITTTFPVSGKFTEAQRQLYQIVLEAKQAAIAVIKPGVLYDQIHLAAAKVIVDGLLTLGLLQGDADTLLKEETYKRYFMHGTGHFLGRDVHDVGLYKINGKWRPLQAGMVLTVEPGLYIKPEAEGVAPEYWGIGIRIEDDVLVTPTGSEILTLGLPRTPEEIEAWMQSN